MIFPGKFDFGKIRVLGFDLLQSSALRFWGKRESPVVSTVGEICGEFYGGKLFVSRWIKCVARIDSRVVGFS